MRMIVRHESVLGCQKLVDIKKREGWSPVNNMEPKLDDSRISWGEVSYVVVMERPDNKEHKERAKNRKWNRSPLGGPLH